MSSMKGLVRIVWAGFGACSMIVVSSVGPGGQSALASTITGPPSFVRAWGTSGTEEGQFDGPMGVMVRLDSVSVVESGNHRIHAFAPDGTFVGMGGVGVVDGSNVWQECTPITLLTTSPCLPGIPGSGALQFDNPIDLADDDDDNTWITDGSNNRVLVLDDTEPATLLLSLGSAGTAEGQFTGIYGIFVTDTSFEAYVTEVGNHRIQKFVPTSPTSIGFDRMWGAGVDDGSAVGQVCTSSCQAGTPGTGEGQFNGPRKAIVGGPFGASTGDVIVADTGNHRLQMFDTNGTFIKMWGFGVADGSPVFQECMNSCQAGIPGTGDGQFDLPSYLAVDDTGNILVADQGNHRIQILDSAGNFLTKWGSFGTGDGQFSSPAGIFFRPLDLNNPATGLIYVSDASNRIQVFAPSIFRDGFDSGDTLAWQSTVP